MDHAPIPNADDETQAVRAMRVVGQLDGRLEESTLRAVQGVWSMLEHAAVDPAAHARAVRSRLFWETLAPGGAAAAPTSLVTDLTAGDDLLADAA